MQQRGAVLTYALDVTLRPPFAVLRAGLASRSASMVACGRRVVWQVCSCGALQPCGELCQGREAEAEVGLKMWFAGIKCDELLKAGRVPTVTRQGRCRRGLLHQLPACAFVLCRLACRGAMSQEVGPSTPLRLDRVLCAFF
jgi:hypothetical protein